MWSLTVDLWCNCVHHISHTDHRLGASFISETPGLRIDFRLVWKIHSTFALNAPLVTPLWVWLNLEKKLPTVFDKSSIRAKFFKILLKQQQQQNIYTAVSSAKCCSLSVLRKDILDIHVSHFFSVYFLCPNPNKIYTFDWKLNTKNVFLLIIVYSYKTLFSSRIGNIYIFIL